MMVHATPDHPIWSRNTSTRTVRKHTNDTFVPVEGYEVFTEEPRRTISIGQKRVLMDTAEYVVIAGPFVDSNEQANWVCTRAEVGSECDWNHILIDEDCLLIARLVTDSD